MYIKENTMRHNFGGFELDTASIGNTSTSKTKIVLPYGGELPADLYGATGAAISVMIHPGLTVSVCLTVEQGNKKTRYPVEAAAEIASILRRFFFDKGGHIRRGTGLSRYELGFWQAHYINWRKTRQTA